MTVSSLVFFFLRTSAGSSVRSTPSEMLNQGGCRRKHWNSQPRATSEVSRSAAARIAEGGPQNLSNACTSATSQGCVLVEALPKTVGRVDMCRRAACLLEQVAWGTRTPGIDGSGKTLCCRHACHLVNEFFAIGNVAWAAVSALSNSDLDRLAGQSALFGDFYTGHAENQDLRATALVGFQALRVPGPCILKEGDACSVHNS